MLRLRRLFSQYSIVLLIIAFLPFRIYEVTKPLTNITNFRQAQTATFALNFYKNGINLFQTELDIFGMGKERFLTLEFPLYEAIVAILYKIFFVSDLWGRAVSITSGFLGAWFLYRLVLLVLENKKLALLSSFIFLATPLNMYHQQDFLIEATVVFFLIAGAFYFCYWVKNQDSLSYVLAIFYLSLGFIQKGVYGPFWLMPLSWFYLHKYKLKAIFATRFIASIGIPLAILFIWQQHVNQINIANGQEYFTTYNQGHLVWNFGAFADRLSIPMWQFRLRNLLNGIFLKPGIFIFLLGFISFTRIKNASFLFTWLLSVIIYFLLLFPIQSHIYYQMMMIPIISIIMAKGMINIADWTNDILMKIKLSKSFRRYIKPISLMFLCTFFIWKSWSNSKWDLFTDLKWYDRIKRVGEVVRGHSYGILVNPGYDWNSVYTYYPRLKMLTVGVENVTKENVIKWRQSGYSYIVLHEYGEYPDYLKINKPGHNLDFLDGNKEMLTLEDFKVYLLNN